MRNFQIISQVFEENSEEFSSIFDEITYRKLALRYFLPVVFRYEGEKVPTQNEKGKCVSTLENYNIFQIERWAPFSVKKEIKADDTQALIRKLAGGYMEEEKL